MNTIRIGILTWRSGKKFSEPGYFSNLIKEGQQLNCEVYLFSPQDVLIPQQKVRGFIPSAHGGWQAKEFAWPDAVIDRYRNFYPKDAFQKYVAFREQTPFLYANNRIGNKWTVYQELVKNDKMRNWLPETNTCGRNNLKQMIARHRTVYVKPINGTGGRGILKIVRLPQGYLALGHTLSRETKQIRFQTETALFKWVDQWVKGQNHIVQQGLDLAIAPPASADMRLLIQKNNVGQWSVTGYGMRVGKQTSAISNLHGGGKAVRAEQLLVPFFGRSQTDSILEECEQLAYQTAVTLEARYGRLLELGIDIGIDVKGRIWMIEVNPKPGRDIFRKMEQRDLYRQSVRNPLQYVLYLVNGEK